jgi:FkbM family methyltransferase
MRFGDRIRAKILGACLVALRFYTRFVPFARGRGILIRAIEFGKRRGWSPPLIPIGNALVMEFEPSLLGRTIVEKGHWEPEQTAVFLSCIRQGDIVINVGANTGYYALLAAHQVGNEGHVYVFEIQPDIVCILKRNIERNGLVRRVTVVEAGCYSSAGEAVIEPRGDPGSARISFETSGTRVALMTLDQFAEDSKLARVNVILIDTEGADFEILKGAGRLLARFLPYVIAEVHHLGTFGASPEALCKYMCQFGYKSRILEGEMSRDMLFVPSRGATTA